MSGDGVNPRIVRLRLAVFIAGSAALLILLLLAVVHVIDWRFAAGGATVVLLLSLILNWVPRLWIRQ